MPKGVKDVFIQCVGSSRSLRVPGRFEATGAGIQLEQIPAATLLLEGHLEQKKPVINNTESQTHE